MKSSMPKPTAMATEDPVATSYLDAAAALYAAERGVGFSVQANLLAVWGAAITYAGVAIALAISVPDSAVTAGTIAAVSVETATSWVVLLLPLPAFAIAGYHLILFGIGLVHSTSISLLEIEVVELGSSQLQDLYKDNLIGSRAEVAWTEGGNASLLTRFIQVAYLLPYFSTAGLATLCLYQACSRSALPSFAIALVALAYALMLIMLLAQAMSIFARAERIQKQRLQKKA